MKILGIDVGIGRTGWAIVEKKGMSQKLTLEAFGVIETEPKIRMEQRLKTLYEKLSNILIDYNPDAAAVESLFFFSNQKTIIQVGQARGVILLTMSMSNIEVFDYTPLQVKTAVTGYGRADKHQIQKMVTLLFGLKDPLKQDDAADAVAIAVCHLNS